MTGALRMTGRTASNNKRSQPCSVGIETQCRAEIQQEQQMEIGEVTFQGIQGHDLALKPIRQSVFIGLVLYYPVKHFAHEERHSVLVNIAPDSIKGSDTDEVPGEPKVGFGILGHFGLEDIQWKEQCHCRFRADLDKKAVAAIFRTQSVQDYGILPKLGVVKDYELCLGFHVSAFEETGHCAEGLPPVGNLVFLFFGDVGGGEAGILIGNEYGVVTEAAATGFLSGDGAVHYALELVDFPFQDKGHHAAEPCPSGNGCCRVLSSGFIILAGYRFLQCRQLGEHLVHVLAEVLSFPGITGCIYPGCTSKRFHFQSGVIREAVASKVFEDIFSLLEGILLEGQSRLGDVFGETVIRRGEKLESFSEDFRGLAEFAAVAGSENDFCDFHEYKYPKNTGKIHRNG